MDKKTILSEIKKMITFSTDVEKEEEMKKYLDAKTTSGAIIRVDGDEFVVGAQVYVVSEDGVIEAGPELVGEHTLEDGSRIVLDETGKIVEILESTEDLEEKVEEEVKEVEEMEVVVDEEVKEVVDETAGMTASVLEEKVEALEKKIEEMEAEIKEMIGINEEMAKFSSHVLSKIDGFVKDTPAQLEFQSIKSAYKSDVIEKREKSQSGIEAIKNIRTKK